MGLINFGKQHRPRKQVHRYYDMFGEVTPAARQRQHKTERDDRCVHDQQQFDHFATTRFADRCKFGAGQFFRAQMKFEQRRGQWRVQLLTGLVFQRKIEVGD